MRIEWLPVAERNHESQLAYIGGRDPWAAINVGDAIEAAVRRLSDHPHTGRLGRVAGTRELVVSGTPFVIAYRVEPDVVVILRLLHGAQRWPTEFMKQTTGPGGIPRSRCEDRIACRPLLTPATGA